VTAPIHLFDLPHDEARRLLGSGAPVFMFVNPVEYHGPHLSLHNDRLISLGLAGDLHARLARTRVDLPFLVGADLEIGIDPAPGPGSRHTPYALARELVREACRALCELGATEVVLMTFHGAPLHNLVLEAGAEVCREMGAKALVPMHLLLEDMLLLTDPSPYAPAVAHVDDQAARERLLSSLRTDFHAGFFESSLTLHYAPDSVSECIGSLPPCPEVTPDPSLQLLSKAAQLVGRTVFANELAFAAIGRGWGEMRPFYGYTSEPAHAAASAGQFFAKIIVDRFAAATMAVLHGGAAAPQPVLRWVETLSLGGRLSGHDLSMDQVFSPST